MKNSFFNYFKSGVVITLISFFAIGLYIAKNHWGISIAVTSAITVLLIAISKYLWKYKPFKWLFWTDNFSGRYEGILKYQYVDENGNAQSGERRHVKVVNQNGSRISVASFTLLGDGTKSSPSYSKGMLVEPTEDGRHYQLTYSYLNEGNSKELSGYYYTNRTPQTRGEYQELKWVSEDLNHEF